MIDCYSSLCSCSPIAKAMAKESAMAIEEVYREALMTVFKFQSIAVATHFAQLHLAASTYVTLVFAFNYFLSHSIPSSLLLASSSPVMFFGKGTTEIMRRRVSGTPTSSLSYVWEIW